MMHIRLRTRPLRNTLYKNDDNYCKTKYLSISSLICCSKTFTYTPCPNSAPSWPSSYRPLIMKHSRDLLWRDSANFHVFLFVPPKNLFNSNIKDTFYKFSYHMDFSGQTTSQSATNLVQKLRNSNSPERSSEYGHLVLLQREHFITPHLSRGYSTM